MVIRGSTSPIMKNLNKTNEYLKEHIEQEKIEKIEKKRKDERQQRGQKTRQQTRNNARKTDANLPAALENHNKRTIKKIS